MWDTCTSHFGPKKFDRVGRRGQGINQHIKLVHNTTKQKCDHSGLVVSTLEKLEAHVVKVHTKVVPVHCEIYEKCSLISKKQIITRVVCTTLENALILNVQNVPKHIQARQICIVTRMQSTSNIFCCMLKSFGERVGF